MDVEVRLRLRGVDQRKYTNGNRRYTPRTARTHDGQQRAPARSSPRSRSRTRRSPLALGLLSRATLTSVPSPSLFSSYLLSFELLSGEPLLRARGDCCVTHFRCSLAFLPYMRMVRATRHVTSSAPSCLTSCTAYAVAIVIAAIVIARAAVVRLWCPRSSGCTRMFGRVIIRGDRVASTMFCRMLGSLNHAGTSR